MAFFKKTPKELPITPPPIDPTVFGAVAQAPILNPNQEEQQLFAVYRADHIASDIEHRKANGAKHPEHDQLIAEAMCYGWMAVCSGRWTIGNVRALQERLLGS